MYRPLTDKTLNSLKKAELIRYIRTLENNYVAVSERCERQFRYIKNIKSEIINEIGESGAIVLTAISPDYCFTVTDEKKAVDVVKNSKHV